MVIDRIDRWTERALALLDSPEGRRIYARNESEYGLDRRNNICGIIREACGILDRRNIRAVYERVEKALAAAVETDADKLRQAAYCFDCDRYGLDAADDDWEEDELSWFEDFGRQAEAERSAAGAKAAG